MNGLPICRCVADALSQPSQNLICSLANMKTAWMPHSTSIAVTSLTRKSSLPERRVQESQILSLYSSIRSEARHPTRTIPSISCSSTTKASFPTQPMPIGCNSLTPTVPQSLIPSRSRFHSLRSRISATDQSMRSISMQLRFQPPCVPFRLQPSAPIWTTD